MLQTWSQSDSISIIFGRLTNPKVDCKFNTCVCQMPVMLKKMHVAKEFHDILTFTDRTSPNWLASYGASLHLGARHRETCSRKLHQGHHHPSPSTWVLRVLFTPLLRANLVFKSFTEDSIKRSSEESIRRTFIALLPYTSSRLHPRVPHGFVFSKFSFRSKGFPPEQRKEHTVPAFY